MQDVKPVWIAAALFAVVAVLFLLTRVSEKVAPAPVALWVAIQPEGEDVARVGAVELPAGTGFRLHAVMEAETFRGGRIYYTEAKQLDLLGEPISSELLRPWSGRLEARVLWFTVEGSTPFRQFPLGADLTAPRFRGIFQPDWGQAWSVTGDLRPAAENFLPGADQVRRTQRFGTQRFQVRIELFRGKKNLTPELRLASWGSEELPGRAAEFPAVTAVLPGVLEAPSRIFGLQQLESESGSQSVSTGKQLVSWTDELIAFSRISVLGNWLAAQGASWEDLDWEAVELGASRSVAQPGDLLRVGRRVVWLLEDRGAAGLGDEDWCLDLERGARVERLGDIFVGEGLVDWARAPGLRSGD